MKKKLIDEKEYYDTKFKSVGMAAGLSGELYCRVIGYEKYLFCQKVNGKWELWIEQFYKRYNMEQYNSRFKVIIKNENLEIVLARTKRYLEFILKNNKKGR